MSKADSNQAIGRDEGINKLRELIKGINIAMLTTYDGNMIHSRPMATQDVEFDGDLWFFTGKDSAKVDEIKRNPDVNVTYSSKSRIGEDSYVSVSGRASVVYDKEIIDKNWSEYLRAYFPQGKEDPNLTCIKVEAHRAEYWDYPSGSIARMIHFVKGVVTGEPAKPGDGGENKKIAM